MVFIGRDLKIRPNPLWIFNEVSRPSFLPNLYAVDRILQFFRLGSPLPKSFPIAHPFEAVGFQSCIAYLPLAPYRTPFFSPPGQSSLISLGKRMYYIPQHWVSSCRDAMRGRTPINLYSKCEQSQIDSKKLSYNGVHIYINGQQVNHP